MTHARSHGNSACIFTKKVIRVEEVVVPDLHCEAWRKVELGLIQTIEVLLG